jgi:hypothetical protein
MCEQHVKTTTCAFNNCEWRSYGMKRLPSGKTERTKSDWKACGDSYFRVDPGVNGVAECTYLAIECRESARNSKTVECDPYILEISMKSLETFLVILNFI